MAHLITAEQVSTDLDRLKADCDIVEAKLHSLEMKLALLEQKINEVDKDLTSALGSASWVIKIFIGSLITAVAVFIVGGGLS